MACFKGELLVQYSSIFFLDDISEYLDKSMGMKIGTIAICHLLSLQMILYFYLKHRRGCKNLYMVSKNSVNSGIWKQTSLRHQYLF